MEENIVYMLKCANQSYYTGWTNNFIKRMKAHQKGTASHYTHAFVPQKVVFVECFDTKSEAMRKEAEIKRLTRNQKEQLIESHTQKTQSFLKAHPFEFIEE